MTLMRILGGVSFIAVLAGLWLVIAAAPVWLIVDGRTALSVLACGGALLLAGVLTGMLVGAVAEEAKR